MDWGALSDEELVLQCRQGCQAAWSTLVRRFQRLVYTIPRRARLPDDVSAEVFQASFSLLFEHIDRLHEPARVRAWLVTTARRETLKQLRLMKAAAATQDVDGVPAASADGSAVEGEDAAEHAGAGWPFASGADDEERWHEVRTAVDRLEPRCRQLIELLFLREPEASYAEVSSCLGMPPGSIGPTRGRCLAQLRKLLAA